MLELHLLANASNDLRAVIGFIAPAATRYAYATPERVGVIVDEPSGARRVISGDELNRAYALMADAEPGTIAHRDYVWTCPRYSCPNDYVRGHHCERTNRCTTCGQPGAKHAVQS